MAEDAIRSRGEDVVIVVSLMAIAVVVVAVAVGNGDVVIAIVRYRPGRRDWRRKQRLEEETCGLKRMRMSVELVLR